MTGPDSTAAPKSHSYEFDYIFLAVDCSKILSFLDARSWEKKLFTDSTAFTLTTSLYESDAKTSQKHSTDWFPQQMGRTLKLSLVLPETFTI